MDFKQQFLEMARISPKKAASMVDDRLKEVCRGTGVMALMTAFDTVVENDLADVIVRIKSGNDVTLHPAGGLTSCERIAVDIVLNNVVSSVVDSANRKLSIS